ncbi:LysR substrate-binding domain-containing protein [Pseudosulfitobacter sp. SM2401]|uniref:LysR family transcriptional regulator n=1 Tax=Pseudosulfitobacter sp. SM2401 TaxID=3350098 RepID=UPI0036F3B769
MAMRDGALKTDRDTMRLEWIDDILAVLDCGSLAQAAEKRMLTQSAFTRRARTIEDSIGTTLFDRRRKPVTLMPAVQMLEPELRELSTRMHKLRHTLRTASNTSGKPLTFVCQHALTTTISPRIVRAATQDGETSVRVRSGNQDECILQLLSKEVDLAIMYALPKDATSDISSAFETVNLGDDLLVPVCAPSLRADASNAVIPTIAYPADVFLGQVFARMIRPRLPGAATTLPIAETALTLAMVQLALSGIGIAWLPLSLVADALDHGDLIRVDDVLPAQVLNIKMVRLRGARTDNNDKIWRHLAEHLQIAP